jgi:hypothetical protein
MIDFFLLYKKDMSTIIKFKEAKDALDKDGARIKLYKLNNNQYDETDEVIFTNISPFGFDSKDKID